MVAPRDAARDLQIENAVAHPVARDGLAEHDAQSALRGIGMAMRNSESERSSRSMWRRSSTSCPPLTSHTS